MAADAANQALPGNQPRTSPARFGQPNSHVAPKGYALPVLDAVVVSEPPFYGTCNGPTGRCLLALGHDGDHVRPEVVPVGKVQTRCSWCGRLICAGPLVNGLESHGLHTACRERIR